MIDGFLLQLPSLAWSDEVADRYGTLKHTLKFQGRPIGELDTPIAVHALSEKPILVTHNTRHFEGGAGLELEDWMVGAAADGADKANGEDSKNGK